jgi:hypothetical protein
VRSICFVLLTLLAFGCGKKEKETPAEPPVAELQAADSVAVASESAAAYRYQVIEAPEHTFGYDIFKGDAMFIHQPHVPGVAGVKGFAREDQAKKAAELMIEKMKSGVIPPTLSEEEIAAILKD